MQEWVREGHEAVMQRCDVLLRKLTRRLMLEDGRAIQKQIALESAMSEPWFGTPEGDEASRRIWNETIARHMMGGA